MYIGKEPIRNVLNCSTSIVVKKRKTIFVVLGIKALWYYLSTTYVRINYISAKSSIFIFLRDKGYYSSFLFNT